MKNPAFPLYAADFLMGTVYMSFEDVGRYIKLLCYQWDSGEIPVKRLGLLVGLEWVNFSDELKEKFEVKNDRILNLRLEKVREKRQKYIEKQALNGSKGGRPKITEKPKKQKDKKPEIPINPEDNPNINPNETLLENGIEIENIFISVFKKWPKFDFRFVPENLIDCVDLWLTYKRTRRETYKSQMSFERMVKQLNDFSEGNHETAVKIIEQSMANNWAGLFQLKEQKLGKNERARQTALSNLSDLQRRIESGS